MTGQLPVLAVVERPQRTALRTRGSWAIQQLSESLQRLRAPEFAEHIHTDHQTVAQVADTVARSVGLPITPSTDGPLRAALRRYAITIGHIRSTEPAGRRNR